MRLLGLLIAGSITRNRRRFILQVVVAFCVTSAIVGGLAVSINGTTRLSDIVDSSGSISYTVSAVDPNGGTVGIPNAVISRLASASNVTETSFSSPVPGAEVVGPNRSAAKVLVWGVNSRHSALIESPVAGHTRVDVGPSAVIDSASMTALGVTPTCVTSGACRIVVNGKSMPVVGIADFSDAGFGSSVLVDLMVTDQLGWTAGATRGAVSASGLPADKVAETLDQIASIDTPGVFVQAPAAASRLRSEVADTWTETVAVVSLITLALGTTAQLGVLLTTVRFRRAEIATLRSLGCTPRFVTAQFCAEPALAMGLGGFGAWFVAVSAARAVDGTDYQFVLPLGSSFGVAGTVLFAGVIVAYLAAGRAAAISPEEVMAQ